MDVCGDLNAVHDLVGDTEGILGSNRRDRSVVVSKHYYVHFKSLQPMLVFLLCECYLR